MLGPAKEEIREEGNRGLRVGLKPLDYLMVEFTEGVDDEDISGISNVLDVFDGGRERGVVREGKNKGMYSRGVG